MKSQTYVRILPKIKGGKLCHKKTHKNCQLLCEHNKIDIFSCLLTLKVLK